MRTVLAYVVAGNAMVFGALPVYAQVCSAGGRDLEPSELIDPKHLLLPELIANLQWLAVNSAQAYGVTPQIWFYDDNKHPNAFACPPSRRAPTGRLVMGLS